MSQVVTELVIDSSGAQRGAADYSRAMDSAQAATDNLARSMTGMSAGDLASLIAVFAGAGAGIGLFIKFVTDANAGMADLGRTARQVGLDVEKFQELRFAGTASGLSNEEFGSGMQSMARQLNDAQREANGLRRLLEQNGVSLRDSNGQLMTQTRLIETAANLMKRAATEQDKIKIAEMVGLTRQWVPLLENGSDAMNALAKEASAAGVILSRETIERAAEFDKEWKKVSIAFSSNFKDAIADILPDLGNLILLATDAFKKVKSAVKSEGVAQGDSIAEDVRRVWEAIKTLNSADDGSIDRLAASLGNLFRLQLEVNSPFGGGRVGGFSIGGESVADHTKNVRGMADEIASAERDLAEQARAANAELEKQRKLAGGGGPKTIIPSRDSGGGDAVDRAINSLRKHTLQQEADAQAVGLGAGALARFRAEAAETAAVLANGGKQTAEQKRQFDELKTAAEAAAIALAKAKINAEISFGRQTAFLTQDDVAIARALASVYGNDVPAALASTEAAAMRANAMMKGIGDSISNNLSNGISDAISGAKSLKDVFSNVATSIVNDIQKMIVKMLIVGPLMQQLQALLGAFGGPGNALPAIALPGGGYSGPIGPVAGLSAPVSSSVATSVPVVSAMRSSIRAGNDNAPRVQVNIVNNSGEKVERRQSSQGGVDIHDIVIGEFKRAAAGGEVDDVMGRFSVSPGTRRR